LVVLVITGDQLFELFLFVTGDDVLGGLDQLDDVGGRCGDVDCGVGAVS